MDVQPDLCVLCWCYWVKPPECRWRTRLGWQEFYFQRLGRQLINKQRDNPKMIRHEWCQQPVYKPLQLRNNLLQRAKRKDEESQWLVSMLIHGFVFWSQDRTIPPEGCFLETSLLYSHRGRWGNKEVWFYWILLLHYGNIMLTWGHLTEIWDWFLFWELTLVVQLLKIIVNWFI